MEEYQAATVRPYGYLFVDLKQNTPEEQRLRSNIFHDSKIRSSVDIQSQVSYEHQHEQIPKPDDSYIKPSVAAREQLSSDHQSANISESSHHTTDIGKTERYKRLSEPIDPKTMAENHSSCMDCGAMYVSPLDLQRHVKRGCPEADEEDIVPPIKKQKLKEEYDRPAFEHWIQEANSQYADKYSKMIDQFRDEGMAKQEAKQEARDLLLPRYKKALMKKYKDFLSILHYMDNSPIHNKVKRAAQVCWDERKHLKRSIALAVEDHKHLLNELLEDSETEDSDTEDSSTEDSDTEDSNTEDSDVSDSDKGTDNKD
jgi:hypothetical protein